MTDGKPIDMWSQDPATVLIRGYGSVRTLAYIMRKLLDSGHSVAAAQWAIHHDIQAGRLEILTMAISTVSGTE